MSFIWKETQFNRREAAAAVLTYDHTGAPEC